MIRRAPPNVPLLKLTAARLVVTCAVLPLARASSTDSLIATASSWFTDAAAAERQYVGRAGVMSRPYDTWNDRWERLRAACRARGLRGRWAEGRDQEPEFHFAPPATPRAVEDVEKSIGHSLPTAFREAVLEFSASVSVLWQIPDGMRLPVELKSIFAGECRWDLQALPDLIVAHSDWLTNCFSNPDNDYDRVWYNKLPIFQVGNGDMVAIDPLVSGQPVVYLSHDDGQGHGYRLGDNFVDYVDRLVRLGCPGSEDWQWLMFTDGPESGLLVDSPAAMRWREWIGLV